MTNPTEERLAGEESVALTGADSTRQATSNTIILQARQQELVSSMYAFTERLYRASGLVKAAPWIQCVPKAGDKLQREDKQM